MATINKQGGDSLYTLVIRAYGTLANLGNFLTDNALTVTSVDSDPIGKEYYYNEFAPIPKEYTFPVLEAATTRSFGTVRANQNIFDYLLTTYGSIDGFYDYIKNNSINRTDDFDYFNVGSTLKTVLIPKSLLTKGRIVSTNGTKKSDLESDYSMDFNLDFKS